MSTIKQFVTLSFGAVMLYLILAHYVGADKTIAAIGDADANIFKTLQGPPTTKGQ
jgi:hypothetical protein